jgi:hypothetical protein
VWLLRRPLAGAHLGGLRNANAHSRSASAAPSANSAGLALHRGADESCGGGAVSDEYRLYSDSQRRMGVQTGGQCHAAITTLLRLTTQEPLQQKYLATGRPRCRTSAATAAT